MISHRYKFIFIDIPKTGSESMRRALLPFCDHDVIFEDPRKGGQTFGESLTYKSRLCQNPECTNKECWGLTLKSKTWAHKTIYDHVEKYGIDIVKDYFVFAVVRNPLEKVASAILNENVPLEEHEGLALRAWDETVTWMYSNIEWLLNIRQGAEPIHRSELDLSLVNFIAYYTKDQSSMFDFIKKRVGLPSNITLGNHNKSALSNEGGHYSSVLSENVWDKIWENPVMKLEEMVFNWGSDKV